VTNRPQKKLGERFFARPTLGVARDLLGRHLVRDLGGSRLVVRIVEVEAYIGQDDSACHAARGRTARTEVMFGPPGRAYIYFTYGMHWLLNVVTEDAGRPAAVLLRAAEPVEGIETMRTLRKGRRDRELTAGPARLCQALGITGELNRTDLVKGPTLYLRAGTSVPDSEVESGPRVGIAYATPEDQAAPWRLFICGNPHVSRAGRTRRRG